VIHAATTGSEDGVATVDVRGSVQASLIAINVTASHVTAPVLRHIFMSLRLPDSLSGAGSSQTLAIRWSTARWIAWIDPHVPASGD
jgi:hypothetical protein